MKPEFIVLVGIPGVGKSTYAKQFNKSYVYLSSDEIRFANGITDGGGAPMVFQQMLRRTKESLTNGLSVIYDATNVNRNRRIDLLQNLKHFDCVKRCICFIEPYEICLQQNAERTGARFVPEKAIFKFLLAFQIPMYCEGWDDIIFVQRNVGLALEDYLVKASSFNQYNKHHHLCLGEHLFKTQEYISKNFVGDAHTKYILENAGLYHDIGKLYTQRFCDSRGLATEEAHYYSHENVGTYLFLTALSSFDLSDKIRIAELINWHMRPHFSMSEDKRLRERKMLGQEFCDCLDMLHEADLYAH